MCLTWIFLSAGNKLILICKPSVRIIGINQNYFILCVGTVWFKVLIFQNMFLLKGCLLGAWSFGVLVPSCPPKCAPAFQDFIATSPATPSRFPLLWTLKVQFLQCETLRRVVTTELIPSGKPACYSRQFVTVDGTMSGSDGNQTTSVVDCSDVIRIWKTHFVLGSKKS